jgi:hypothetical protein
MEAESGGHCRGHLCWIPQWREIHKDDAIWESITQAGRHRHGEASLSDTCGARQGKQANAIVAQESPNFTELFAASDQPREPKGQARVQARGRDPHLGPDRTTGTGQEYSSLTPDES